MMMRFTALLIGCAALSGCFNIPHKTALPDGSDGYVVNRCRYLENCLSKAREVCGGPYEVKSQSESFHNGFTIMVSCKAK